MYPAATAALRFPSSAIEPIRCSPNIKRIRPIKRLRRMIVGYLAVVMLIGWFNAPAIGDVQTTLVGVRGGPDVNNLITPVHVPNYDTEILVPLHQKQAAIAAAQAAEAARLAEIERAREVQLAQSQVTGDCQTWIAQAGITDVQDAVTLINWESGCDPTVYNRSGSGACGVAQELPCGKSGCVLGDGACQVRWMNTYVLERYGSWANAVAFHRLNGWY